MVDKNEQKSGVDKTDDASSTTVSLSVRSPTSESQQSDRTGENKERSIVHRYECCLLERERAQKARVEREVDDNRHEQDWKSVRVCGSVAPEQETENLIENQNYIINKDGEKNKEEVNR